jgi:hypothetical protein
MWLSVSDLPPPFPVIRRLSNRLSVELVPIDTGYASASALEEELRRLVAWYQRPRGGRQGRVMASLMSLAGKLGRGTDAVDTPATTDVDSPQWGGAMDTDGIRDALRLVCQSVVLEGLMNNQLVLRKWRVPRGTHVAGGVLWGSSCLCLVFVLAAE